MLADGGYDGDVVLGVRGIQEGVETPGPGGYLAGEGEDATSKSYSTNDKAKECFEEKLELFLGEL